ncbi:MAG: hypothetical protein ABI880_11280 [Acidobacteriota bacterium]
MRRVIPALLATLMLVWGCSTPSGPVLSARQIDFVTTYAHKLLRARFFESPLEEDAADLLLLQRLATLDAVDDSLPDKLEHLEAEAAASKAAAVRRDILHDLDAITDGLAQVMSALRPRPAHDAVRATLAPLPSELAELKLQLAATAPLASN